MWPRLISRGRVPGDDPGPELSARFNVAAADQPRKGNVFVFHMGFLSSFNVAAADQPRKGAGDNHHTVGPGCFNVAAADQPRKDDAITTQWVSTNSLQCGRG